MEENEPMSSVKNIIIQTALRPMTIAWNEGEIFHIEEVTDFSDFFEKMNALVISKDTHIYVNRGPGSYSGLRTGISYVYGLLHGGLIDKKNIHSFTSFQLIRVATNTSSPIFIKAWPRLANGLLEGSKGYFEEGEQQLYKTYEGLTGIKNLVCVTEEQLDAAPDGLTNEKLVTSEDTYIALTKDTSLFTNSLEPLYINPVHIT